MSGDSRTFPPIKVPTLTLVSAPGGTFNPSIATSLAANVAQTSAYSLILPSGLPSAANQALLSDTSGNLSWGTVASSTSTTSSSSSTYASYGTFAATAPQSTPANVTGLIATNPLTAINVIVSVNATTKLYVVYTMQMYQKGSATSWGLTYSSLTDTDDTDVGLVFTITSAGQVQYTSPSYTGWISTTVNWYASYTVASTLTSQVTNTFAGASNVVTPTTITGLLVPTNGAQMTVNVFVNVTATTNLSAIAELKVYQNAAGTGYVIAVNSVGDNIGVAWSVTTAGQIQYTSISYSGFTSLGMSWTTPFTVATTATSIPSLALTAGLTVGTNTILAQSANSGSVVSTMGSLVHVTGSTYTDASTAASSTASGTFNGMYVGIPTLSAVNTAVTNSLASTLTIAGPPSAGTNTTITNAYALNVQSGISFFGGGVTATSLINPTLPRAFYQGNSSSYSATAGSTLNFPSSLFTSAGAAYTNISIGATSSAFTIPISGNYVLQLTTNLSGSPATGTNQGIQLWFTSSLLNTRLGFNTQFVYSGQYVCMYAGPLMANDIITPTGYTYQATTYANGPTNLQLSIVCTGRFV